MSFLVKSRGSKENIGDLASKLKGDNSCTHAKNVRIVVLTGHLSGILVAAKSRADSGMLVSRDRNADTRAANKDSAGALALSYLGAKSVNGNGIVTAFGGVSTLVDKGVALCLKVLDKLILVLKSCVVTRDYNVLVFQYYVYPFSFSAFNLSLSACGSLRYVGLRSSALVLSPARYFS